MSDQSDLAKRVLEDGGVWKAMHEFRNGNYSELSLVNAILRATKITEPEYTYGHCEQHKQQNGCQLHNLQCGYPDCDRRPASSQPLSESPK